METIELENKLNKEYKSLGTIKIKSFVEQEIDVTEIKYVADLMDKISPLESDEPIVVDKGWRDDYVIIDGYHRVKNKLSKKEKTIKAYVLEGFSIKRKNDNLLSFLESLVGQNITFLNSNLLLVDGKHYQIEENEGCGGCGSGWSKISVFKPFLNKLILVKKVESQQEKSEYGEDDEYKLVINGNYIADVDTGWGNGYYGGDFTVKLII